MWSSRDGRRSLPFGRNTPELDQKASIAATSGAAMRLTDLDHIPLFSITAWRSSDGWTVGIQRQAGEAVKYVTKRTLSEAIEAVLPARGLPPPPFQVVG